MAGLFRVVGFTTFALLRRLEPGMAARLERQPLVRETPAQLAQADEFWCQI